MGKFCLFNLEVIFNFFKLLIDNNLVFTNRVFTDDDESLSYHPAEKQHASKHQQPVVDLKGGLLGSTISNTIN